MTPDWDNLKLDPEIVADLRAKYENATATLQAKLETGEEWEVDCLRAHLARIEESARTGIVGDQPEELTAEDEEILDRVWATPLEDLPSGFLGG